MEGTKEIVGEKLKVFEIMKINVIKELVEIESRKSEAIETMKESLGEFEIKMLKNEIKALEKIARDKVTEIERDKKEINEIEGMVILEIKTRTRTELDELEIERINEIKELKLIPY